ncbi:hypothetical protein BCR33DRAFT_716689 [Rhizoclosmatium globosum]|uniref:Uncharacterized protein n=1 Tax=Rhizoclosmatium globosum TaxID=329046 RepID=A0A1Y2B164_9FUNG|nr:hypothetical protein BCR33DRAFT_726576 [Rhizoclosmatium globosum]ORY28579.1 hypothetical protein BCR33DRAFT_725060 [Rhizoclosmatium globosum]ORY41968.1 hypothetical protein BCR33DRAFT_718605 [Rhizoclosmatium globosum]ORY44719.1 hypothetical protein BCR33DRAFT_716689 [Rhizoclosmatium globosum]|eukprot:ORY25964.1 hypothetical protein BCR33DRAFT_726576 [Rhizoclosmatium globosum]
MCFTLSESRNSPIRFVNIKDRTHNYRHTQAVIGLGQDTSVKPNTQAPASVLPKA